MASRVPLVQMVKPARKVLQDLQDPLDLPDLLEALATKAPLVATVRLVRLAMLDHLDRQDHLVRQGTLGNVEIPDLRATPVYPVLRAQAAKWDRRVTLDLLEFTDHLVRVVCLDLVVGRDRVESRVVMVLQVVMATEVHLVSLVKMVLVGRLWFKLLEGSSLDRKDHQETLGTLALRVPLVLLALPVKWVLPVHLELMEKMAHQVQKDPVDAMVLMGLLVDRVYAVALGPVELMDRPVQMVFPVMMDR